MKRAENTSRGMSYVWLRLAFAACLASGMATCTINSDNGSPAMPGPNNPNTPPDTTPAGVYPLFLIPQVSDIKPGDTLAFTFTLINNDPNDTSGITKYLRSARVRIHVTPDTGWLQHDSVLTDVYGRATVRYSDTHAGSRQIVLSYAGASSAPIRFAVTPIIQAEQKLIEAKPEKATVVADGKSYTYINVTVINAEHNPMVGEQVRFIATAGVIAGDKPPSPSQSGISVTDEDGVARARLTSTNMNDTAHVTVFLVSDPTMTDETEVAFYGVHIDLSVDTTNLHVGQNTIVTAELLNGANEAISASPVIFIMTSGTTSNFEIVEKDTLTGFDGRAQALLNGVRNGSDTLIVAAAGARTELMLNVTNLALQLTLGQTQLVASDTARTKLTVTFSDSGAPLVNKVITVKRIYPLASGAPTSDTLPSQNTNAAGKAEFTILGIPYDGTMELEVTAYSALHDIATGEASITYTTTRNLTIEAVPTVIMADGSSTSEITVQVKTDDNNPIVGDTVIFSTTAGLISRTGITDENGRAAAVLQSDRRNVDALVRAALKRDISKTDSVIVTFSGITITANAMPRSISSSGADTCLIQALVTDGTGSPIPGESVNFAPQQDSTRVVKADRVTSSSGRASCKIVGKGTGTDTVTIVAAGATVHVVIFYSSNYLTVDTAAGQRVVADGVDSTRIVVNYRRGDKTTPIVNALVNVSVTLGDLGNVFARELRTDATGQAYFWIHNPTFANTATISVEAADGSEITTTERSIYFRASNVYKILLTGTPEVIATNGGRTTITAVVFDSLMNRVKDAHISFNLLEGPGGGEHLDPATAITGIDGVATTSFVSGTVPSMFHEIAVVAGDFTAVKSDTVFLTIAGPPHYITLRTNILSGVDYKDGTFGLPCAAIVTDINGNPVADGTEVTFSCKVSGYNVWKYTVHWVPYYINGYYSRDKPQIDTTWFVLPMEDLNDNYRLDAGEDRNADGVASRGEDINGDGIYNTGPGFEDINHNGVRDSGDFVEPMERWSRTVTLTTYDTTWKDTGRTVVDTIISHSRTEDVWDSAFADFNGNNKRDMVEPLLNSNLTWEQYVALRDAVPGGLGFDVDMDGNGRADPATAVSIKRTVQTVGGKATNTVMYGQSDATRIEVRLSAESQGITTLSPEVVILPIVQ